MSEPSRQMDFTYFF